MLNREPVVIEDIYADERIPHDAYRPTFVKSLAMVPIRTLDPIGAIGNYWATRHRPGDEQLELLQALADSTAVALENVRVYQELEEARSEILQRLALAAEYRDDSTYEHTQRVARTAALLATELGLPPAEVTLIEQAAPLHDIGKLAISDTLLLKPGKLTPDEFAAPRAGDRQLPPRMVGRKGYPNGLSGEAIPHSGRIVAVADVFDALTHERPYKPAWTPARAAHEIQRLGGRQFDPAVVAAFNCLDATQLTRPLGAGPAHRAAP
jgi:HD-GYP domain-containing protein (c-di-GMP phosphodiesterase class II)